MHTERQPKKLGKWATLGTGLVLAAAGTGVASAQSEPTDSGTGFTLGRTNETYVFGPNTVIKGDIKVNGTKLYDNNSESGLVTLLTQNANVSADSDWSYFIVPNETQVDEAINQATQALDESGCGNRSNGCTSVKTIVWPETLGGIVFTQGRPNESYVLGPNTVIRGDVSVNGIKLHDDDPTTGLVTLLKQAANVSAENGDWSYAFAKDKPEAKKVLKEAVEQMDQAGCDNPKNGGCEIVDTIIWPSDKLQRSKENETSSPQPQETPEVVSTDRIKEDIELYEDLDPIAGLQFLKKLIANGFDVNAPENQETLQFLITTICQCGLNEDPKPTPIVK